MKGLVNSQNSIYTDHIQEWKLCRAATSGGVLLKNSNYLVKPTRKVWTDEDEADWKLYNDLAVYYNGTGRAVEGMTGLVFKTKPSIEAPEGADQILESVTSDSQGVIDIARVCVMEVITTGKVALLVDYPAGDERGLTVADRVKMNRRPYLAVYVAESIIDWRVQSVNKKTQLSFVKLFETVSEQDPLDEFSSVVTQQYRVLDLTSVNPADRDKPELPKVYRQRLFKKVNGEWVLSSEVFPLNAGKYFDYIPMTIMGVEGASPNASESPISDLARLNIGHYQNSADYEWGLHFAGSPTAVFSGAFAPSIDGNDDVLEIRLGSRSGIHFQDSDGKAGYLEFTGQGLGAIKDAMDTKWSVMATLGARILSPEKKQAETAEAAMIHREGESSVLANIATVVSCELSWAMNILLKWAGIMSTGKFKINLNTEYIPTKIDAGTLDSLVRSWMAGALTTKDLYYNFNRSGTIAPDQTYDEWKESLDTAEPIELVAMPKPNQDKVNA